MGSYEEDSCYRRSDEPLLADDRLNEKPLVVSLDDLISRASEKQFGNS